MTNHPLNMDQVSEVLSSMYKIGEVESCEFIRRSFNDHYLIKTQEETFVLRIYFDDKYYIKDYMDFEFELELLVHLHEMHVPVAYPLKNKDGNYLSVNQDHCYYALFTFAKGKALEQDMKALNALSFGTHIGEMHVALDQVYDQNRRYQVDVNYLIEEPLALLEKHVHAFDLQGFAGIKNYYTDSKEKLSLINDHYGYIHGDLNPSNIHMTARGSFTFFDFDHMARGHRMHDLAVVKLCFSSETFQEVLNGYISIRSLEQNVIDLIDDYALALILRKYKDVLNIKELPQLYDPSFDLKTYTEEYLALIHKYLKQL